MGNQKGMIIVVGLILLTVLTIIGMCAVGTMIFDTRISANYDAANQAFYTADSGIEDAKSRLRNSGTSPLIVDNEPENPNWMVLIGTQERADQKGLSGVTRLDKLEPSLDYFVTITHKVNDSNITLKWGDANGDGISEENPSVGVNIYLLVSEGWSKENSQKTLQAEVTKFPPVNVPSAIYTKSNTTIKGSSTQILGADTCGTKNKPGIITMGTVTLVGDPLVTGEPMNMVEGSTVNINIGEIVNTLKPYATHAYDLSGDTTMSGVNWGTPTLISNDLPSSCEADNLVHFNMHGSTIKLSGGSSGCGTLLVEGNLDVNGGFLWYGPILVTGTVKFSGGGDENVTGGVLSGGSTEYSDLFSGNISIIYCSISIKKQTDDLPSILLNWKE